jgi:hypothetical protein
MSFRARDLLRNYVPFVTSTDASSRPIPAASAGIAVGPRDATDGVHEGCLRFTLSGLARGGKVGSCAGQLLFHCGGPDSNLARAGTWCRGRKLAFLNCFLPFAFSRSPFGPLSCGFAGSASQMSLESRIVRAQGACCRPARRLPNRTGHRPFLRSVLPGRIRLSKCQFVMVSHFSWVGIMEDCPSTSVIP